MKITFCGGARSVTGANYLLEHNGKKIIVDCGLNQGSRYAEDLNYKDFAYDPATIDYVFITHSHIDHIGRVPKLYKNGFRGILYTTTATRDMMALALPDNMQHIIREAEEDNHEPLFDNADFEGSMKLIQGVYYKHDIDLGEGITARLHDAGHILGSAIIEITWTNGEGKSRRILFSGDLGNPPTPLLCVTEYVKDADYVVVESAYGDRLHEAREERKQKLQAVVEATINRGGVLLIPSFAVERTQELLFELDQMSHNKNIPQVPIFVDSPLAIKMTEVYKQHADYFNKDANYLINSGDDIFQFPGLKMTLTVDESKAINDIPAPKVIIAGSGMSQGGRILHHEQRYLSDPKNTILFVGYQVDGSLGRRIQEGDAQVKIFGKVITIRAHRETISSYSAHADQKALLHWVAEAKTESEAGNRPFKVFVVQGEESSAKTLAALIHDNLGLESMAPTEGESFELT